MSGKLAGYADGDECPSYHRLTPDHDDQARPNIVELAAGIALAPRVDRRHSLPGLGWWFDRLRAFAVFMAVE